MKSFMEFAESSNFCYNEAMDPSLSYSRAHIEHLRGIERIIEEKERKIYKLNDDLDIIRKIAAKVKIDLERALKSKDKIHEVVLNSINLLRTVTPYSSDYGLTNKIDPPLTTDDL